MNMNKGGLILIPLKKNNKLLISEGSIVITVGKQDFEVVELYSNSNNSELLQEWIENSLVVA